MTQLRTGVIPTLPEAAPDLIEVGEHARASAAAYTAWLDAGKTREQLEAEQRQRHPPRPPRKEPDDNQESPLA